MKDICPGTFSSSPAYLTNVNGTLYFRANDGTTGYELWKSDGTEGGTVPVKDIYAGSGTSSPQNLTNVNGTLYFTAVSGTTGYELWKSDGTEAGTVLVRDIYAGGSSSSPANLTNVNGTLYFTAVSGTTGRELWKSDGTEAGTVLVKDIYAGIGSSTPENLTNVNGTLCFTALSSGQGTELWKSDGTAAGTVLVKDIHPGSSSSGTQYLTPCGSTLFFSANDGVYGSALWVYEVPGLFPAAPERCTIAASPTSIAADGASTSTITVQVNDAGGSPVAGGGNTVVLSNGGAGTLSEVTYTTNGAYTATLTAPTAAGSATITATVDGEAVPGGATVIFTPGPAARLAFTGGPANALVGAGIPVQVSALDANGNVATGFTGHVALAIKTGPAGAVLSGTTEADAAAGVAGLAPVLDRGGTYVLTAASGALAVDSAGFTVNTPPTLNPIGNKVAAPGVALTFTAAASDPDTPAQTLSFSLAGAPAGAGINAATGEFSWTPAAGQAGQAYTFTVRVTDSGDPAGADEEAITVSVNRAPTADAGGPYASDVDGPLALDASGSTDADTGLSDSIVEYAWDLDHDGTYETTTASAALSVPWATLSALDLAAAGTRTLGLRVTDSFGAAGTDTATWTLYRNEPAASFTAGPNPARAGQSVHFDASASFHGRPDRAIVSYAWDFGDGTTGAGLTTDHTYSTYGAHTVVLTVTDNNVPPRIATATRFVNVLSGLAGAVRAWGLDNYGQCHLADWSGVVAVAAGRAHTVGLKEDGTVAAAGANTDHQCDVGGWAGVVAVAAGSSHTVGLMGDGAVVATGLNYDHQCDVSGWTGMSAVAAGRSHTVGLKGDGTVVAAGLNYDHQCDVSGWTGIVAVAAGSAHTVGLKGDGTVVAAGLNNYGQCDVSGWIGIVAVAAAGSHTVGLKSDGRVVAVGHNGYSQCDVGAWSGMAGVAAGLYHTVGLKDDGSVVTLGYNAYGQCSVPGDLGMVMQVAAGSFHTVVLDAPGNTAPTVGVDQAAVTVDEGATATNTGTWADGDGGTVTLTASDGTVTKDANGPGTWSWSLACPDGPAGPQTVTITADDGQATSTATFTVTVTNVAPLLTAPDDQETSVGVAAAFDPGSFTDPGADADWSVAVDWGDGTACSFTTAATGGLPVRPHTYDAAGTYTVTVTVTDPDGGASAAESFTATVSAPALTIRSASTTEGNASTKTLSFTVVLSAPAAAPVTVNWATAGVSATAGSDFVAGGGTLTFAAGQTTKAVAVSIKGDALPEANEAFAVNLTGPVNAVLADGEAYGVIVNDDNQPALSIGNVTRLEGDAATTTAFSFPVTLSAPAAASVTVHWETADGSATAGGDYVAGSGTLTFAAGQTSKTVSVTVNGDNVVEANETFRVILGGASGAVIAVAQGLGAILNDEPRAANDAYVVTAGAGPLTVAAPGVLANDVGVGRTAAKITNPGHGTVSLAADGSFTYTPAAGYVGVDSFVYEVRAGGAAGNRAAVGITVKAAGKPTLAATVFSSSRNGVIHYRIAFKNTGTAQATNLRVSKALMGTRAATSGVGTTTATLAAGATWYVDFQFPLAAGNAGATGVLNLAVTFTQGSYAGGLRVTLP